MISHGPRQTFAVLLLVIAVQLMTPAVEPVELSAPLAPPLSTALRAPDDLPAEAGVLTAAVSCDGQEDPSLGASLFLCDDTGQWYQERLQHPLRSGATTSWTADLADAGLWAAEPGRGQLSAAHRPLVRAYGVVVWSTGASGGMVHARLGWVETTPAAPSALRLLGLDGPRLDATGCDHLQAGERWSLALEPEPWPADPYDPAVFNVELEVTDPHGQVLSYGAFYDAPMALHDRGDRETATVDGNERFVARFRPQEPGVYHLALLARWGEGPVQRTALPPLVVAGPRWNGYLRLDARDPRFFATGVDGADFVWPIGLNLQSASDQRANRDYQTRPTTDRGTQVYDAYFSRLAAAGGTAAEIWLCSWNLALEWNPRWPGYHGLGRYNQANAARLDRVLDLAWSHHLRLVINLDNHGQVINPPAGESEWVFNPYNHANGGPALRSEDFFSDPEAMRYQDRLRRYIAARYADHPGVLAWKLFSEVDLTQLGISCIRAGGGGMEELRSWHDHAAGDWHRLDHYHHPVASHVATTYMNADPRLFSSPELDIVALDAYYAPGVYTHASNLAGLMIDTMDDPDRGLADLNKSVLVTEYGGGFHEIDHDKLGVEHRTGAWLALVTGEAASPMLWWHEWVDQHDQWGPYGAIARFTAGEDWRGVGAHSASLDASASDGRPLWARAWLRPGLMLGYLEDAGWANDYRPHGQVPGGSIAITEVGPGRMRLEWWDCDHGIRAAQQVLTHAGGTLTLAVPAFTDHLAFKLRRLP